MSPAKGLAVVTGASAGIGYELARRCAADGYDLLIASDEERIHVAAGDFEAMGVKVGAVKADLATEEGVEALCARIEGPVDLLLANAGHGLGDAFLDQDMADIRHVIDTNVTGTVMLVHRIGRDMRARNRGRILLTGSIAGFIPGSFHAVYNASKAFVDSFSWALRNELEDTDVTVTCLMPGATDTDFFERAGMMDTKVGADPDKDDPATVARVGYDAMMEGRAGVVSGMSNKLQVALAHVTPAGALAQQHRRMAEPGTAKK